MSKVNDECMMGIKILATRIRFETTDLIVIIAKFMMQTPNMWSCGYVLPQKKCKGVCDSRYDYLHEKKQLGDECT